MFSVKHGGLVVVKSHSGNSKTESKFKSSDSEIIKSKSTGLKFKSQKTVLKSDFNPNPGLKYFAAPWTLVLVSPCRRLSVIQSMIVKYEGVVVHSISWDT